MLFNIIMLILIFAIIGYVLFRYYKVLKTQKWEEDKEIQFTLDYLTQGVAETFADTLKQNLKELNLSRVELEKKDKIKSELRSSLKEAAYGNKDAKTFIKKYIRDILQQGKRNVNEMTINNAIHFDSPKQLKSREKFEIIMHIYNKKYKEKGFVELIKEFGLADPIYRDDGSFYYEITEERISEMYSEIMTHNHLSYDDKLDILAQRIFADYKGFGAADILFETTIDEIDCGVSGIPQDSYDIKASDDIKDAEFSYESIWVMVFGVNIKMSCLSFGTHDELVRVCQNIYKYNAPQALSRRNGNVVSTMKDGSRIVVVRPPFCESWAFFARKFDSAPSIAPQILLGDEGNIIPITLMKWFIKGYRTIAVTGSQGTGKTTTLKSLIRFIPEDLNLRIQELAFELNLRYTYPKRNIVTFQETESISAQDGLNLQKKTNGSVNIIGEVATAEAASWVIQTAMVASLYTIFTHHAKTSHDLIVAIRNNLLETGGYSNEKAAEEMVAKVLNIDMHMEKLKGHRFCSRITEIIPIQDRRYPSDKDGSEMRSLTENLSMDTIEYQKRVTDRQLFDTVNLCEWRDGKYYMRRMPTYQTMMEIRNNLSADEEKLFIEDMKMLESMIED